MAGTNFSDYKNIDEIKNNFNTVVEITDLDHFKQWYLDQKSKKDDFLYRGISHGGRKLYPSSKVQFELYYKNYLQDYKSFLNVINRFSLTKLKLYKDYKRKENLLEYYINKKKCEKTLKIKDNLIYRFFSLQHVGIPTPLIDFSESLDVAIFFAIDGYKKNGNTELSHYIQLNIIKKISNQPLKNIIFEIDSLNPPFNHSIVFNHFKKTTDIINYNYQNKIVYIPNYTSNSYSGGIPYGSIDLKLDSINKNNKIQKGWEIINNTEEPLEELIKGINNTSFYNSDKIEINKVLISANLCDDIINYVFPSKTIRSLKKEYYPLKNKSNMFRRYMKKNKRFGKRRK